MPLLAEIQLNIALRAFTAESETLGSSARCSDGTTRVLVPSGYIYRRRTGHFYERLPADFLVRFRYV